MTSYMMSKKTMEINPSHGIIRALKERHTKNENDATLKDLVILLYESFVEGGCGVIQIFVDNA